MLGYLSLDNIVCSSKLTVFLEQRSRKTVRFLEQIMSADKYPSICSRQREVIVHLYRPWCLSQWTLSNCVIQWSRLKELTTEPTQTKLSLKACHNLSTLSSIVPCLMSNRKWSRIPRLSYLVCVNVRISADEEIKNYEHQFNFCDRISQILKSIRRKHIFCILSLHYPDKLI